MHVTYVVQETLRQCRVGISRDAQFGLRVQQLLHLGTALPEEVDCPLIVMELASKEVRTRNRHVVKLVSQFQEQLGSGLHLAGVEVTQLDA